MTKYEYSAGGVIYRKGSKGIEILLLKDKNSQWSFPKGLIEDKENLIKTAEREIEEEVGLRDLQFVNIIDSIRYFYRFQGSLIRKKVDYYLFAYKGNDVPKPQTEEGIQDVRWVGVDEARRMIGYVKTNKPMLDKAIKMIA